MDIVPVLLVVTFIVLLVCYFLQSRLQSLGFSVDQLLLGGLGGIAFVPARTSSLPLKYLRLEALKFELVSKGKLFSLSLREVRVRLILPHGQNGASSRPAQESTASKTSQDWTSKKEELSRKLDRLRSLIFWLHIPSISRFFGVFISDVVVDVQFGVLPESPSLKLCINEAFIGLKSAKLEENGKSSRRHGDLALQLEVKVKGFEIRNDLDQCLARLSSIQGLLEKDKSEETIKLPTCAITLEELTVFSKSLMEWSNALKKERPTPSKFSDQVRMLLTPSQSVSGSPLTPQTPKLNSALLNELMEQLEDAWEKMATFQPVLKVALHQTRICHAESKDLVFDLTLTGSSLTLEYSKPTKTLGLSAQMTDILGTVAIHDDDFTLVKLAEGDLKVGLRPPHIHVSQNRERSHIQLDIKNLQVSINNILIRILLHHKAQQSSLSTPAPPPLRQDSIQRIVLLIHTFLHMYQFTLKIQLTDTAALLSMVNYKESNNMAFLARVRVVNLAFDTNVAMDHEPLPELKRTLGHGNLVASTLTMGILESTSRDPLLSDSLDNVQKVAETLGLSLKCAVILESIRLDNRKKSFVKLQFIGGSELLLGNLTGIRDDSDKIDYKALLRSLKDTFQLPKEVRKKRISEFPLVTSGSLECPEIRIDCLSEKIDMGSRLEIRDLVVQMGTEDDSLNPLTKLQLGTLMVITFQANRFAEMHQSLKNVAIKVQGISCQVRKELSIDCQMEHASLTFSTLDLYIAIVSLQHLIRISKVPPQNGAIKPFSPIPIIVLLDRLDVKWTLATDVVLKLHLTPFKSTIQDELIQLSIEEVGMAALVDPTINRFESLGLIRDLDVKVNKSLKFLDDASLFSITIQGKNLLITVPNGYKLEDVIENMINLGKFIKELSMTHLDFVPSGYCKDGRTVIDPTEIPRIHVAVAELVFIMQDDPFEIRLNQNYHVGLREQLSRLVRDRAFEKQVSMRRDVSKKDAEFSKDDMQDIDRAEILLKEFNSKSWIEHIKKAKAEEGKDYGLLKGVAHEVCIILDPPTLPARTVEESLNCLDYTTPANLIYEELIPRNISFSLMDLSVTLRDYPDPLVIIPRSASSTATWVSKGLLFIVGQPVEPESCRIVDVDVGHSSLPKVRVMRTVNPVKTYLQTQSTIITDGCIQVSWGAAIEPCLADMIRMIDSFTKETVDPSPPVGWWDKIRLMMHGQNTITVSGGCEVRVHALGSFSPYYNPEQSCGTHGIDICLNNGIKMELGGDPDQGKDVVIECGQLFFSIPSTGANSAQTDTKSSGIFARLTGGVCLMIGVTYVAQKTAGSRAAKHWKRHCDVSLRSPDFCSSEMYRDSWEGYRTQSINLTFNITSPRSFYSGLSEPSNSLNLTIANLNNLGVIGQVYQSVLTNQPIRSGSYFAVGSQKDALKPKLGRMISTIRLVAEVYPLVLSFLAATEHISSAVGVRVRSDEMLVDLRLSQRQIAQSTKGQKNLLKRKSVSKWNLEESRVDFANLEMRTLSCGFSSDTEDYFNESGDAEADNEWILESDLNYETESSKMKLYPFITSPKLTYYRRTDDFRKAMDQESKKKIELYDTQITLFQKRLREIEAAIWQCLKMQQSLAARTLLFFDDSLKMKTEQLIEHLAMLHEKKAVIERYIRKCELRAHMANGLDRAPRDDDGSFRHVIIVHNCNFLWKPNVRNVIFKMFDLMQRNSALKYCVSYAAYKMVSQLAYKSSTIAPVNELPRGHSTASQAESEKKIGFSNMDQLLQILLEDLRLQNRMSVPNEKEEESASKKPEGTFAPKKRIDKHILLRRATLIPDAMYVPSTDPQAPDYIGANLVADGELLVQFINPQVSFETSAGTGDALQSVVVAADSMEFKAVAILDRVALLNSQGYDDADKTVETVKNRHIYSIKDAQFLVAKNNHLADSFQATSPLESSVRVLWPIFVPIECLIDHTSDTGPLQRVVDNTSVLIHRDKQNPLYVQRSRESQMNEPAQENFDSLHIAFPEFATSLTSAQFQVISDTVANLLIYNDPTRRERKEQLRKMVLVLEQSDDMTKILESVAAFQNKVKRADTLLKLNVPVKDLTFEDIWRCLFAYQDELFVLLEAFKMTRDLENKKKSIDMSSRVEISIEKLLWHLYDENGEFCRLTLNCPRFETVNFEDYSSRNTLEFDTLYIENLSAASSPFKEVLSPLVSENKIVNFKRNKMLRLHWKEIPPVAGIQVFHHFEINMFPLLIQMTFDVGKKLMYYFFPNRGQLTTQSSKELSVPSDPKLDSALKSPDILGKNRLLRQLRNLNSVQDLKLMQTRATQNKSFIYVKVPGVNHCVSYKGSKDKNLEDLHMFPFHMPTLEYRNKTWSWYDFIEALKKDAVRVIFANTGALVREKIFQQKRKTVAGGPGNSSLGQQIDNVSDTAFSSMGGGDAQSDISTEETIKSTKPQSKRFFSGLFRKQQQSALSPSSEATFATNRLLEPSENGSLSSFGSGPDGHFRSVSEGTGTSGLVGSSTKGDSQEDVERESRLHDRGRLLFGKHYPLPPPTSIRA